MIELRLRISSQKKSHLLLIPWILGMLVQAVDDPQKAINQMKSSEAEETYAWEKIEEKAPVEKPEIEDRQRSKY